GRHFSENGQPVADKSFVLFNCFPGYVPLNLEALVASLKVLEPDGTCAAIGRKPPYILFVYLVGDLLGFRRENERNPASPALTAE
ncbi:hypothetical protein, partial [Neobacillus paridis]|uniref:hypothetical protein n=1 Tax=Neobacillus paridis TaxID=2803862 RepID=UPI001F2F5AE3